jgi:imidazolonepropionase-like amidohydrolase
MDLGWDTSQLTVWTTGIPGLDVSFAGNFLAAVGGYPSDREWAPAGATVFLSKESEATHAVAAQVASGASAIKITLNSTAGRVHSDATLAALVAAAREVELPPVIHAEGLGQAERAIHLGEVVLAHTPFSEVLSDALITRAAQTNIGWMSTLDIHGYGNYTADFEVACENLRRFNAAGGTVFYGTDLGNGPLPMGINSREIAALESCDLTAQQIVSSLTSWWEQVPSRSVPTRSSFISDISDNACENFSSWLVSARIVENTEVES